jgi:hypothetical protein
MRFSRHIGNLLVKASSSALSVRSMLRLTLLLSAVVAVLAAVGCSSGSSGSKLVITMQPGSVGAGQTTAMQVSIEDSNGNVTDASDTITIAIGTNPSGGALGGTTTVAANGGVANFEGLSINDPGTGYTLTANDQTNAAVTSATSAAFNIYGVATQMVFTTQPGGGDAGTTWGTQPVLAVEDSGGRTVLNYNLSVTLTINNNPGGGTLTCTNNPVAAVAGVATFAGCEINQPSNGYTLKASSGGLGIVSSTFTITAAGSLSASCSGFPTGSESLLTGHWAALLQGWTGTISTNYPLAQVLAFSSNGSGGFNNLDGNGTAGQIDAQNGSGGSTSYLNLTIETTGSSYSIGLDPTSSGYVGCMTLATYNTSANETGPTVHLVFTLGGISGSAASKGQIITWNDTTGTANHLQGILLPQDSSEFAISLLQSSYATELNGVNPNGTPYASAASISLNTSTGAVSGVADSDDAGDGCLDTTISGSFSANTTSTPQNTEYTGRVTGSITPACTGVASDRVVYIINKNELFILTTDAFTTVSGVGMPILSGRAIVQTGHGSFSSSSVSGNYMFHMTGISTGTSGNGCSGANCATVNLGVVSPTSTGADTLNFNGASWQYQPGDTVTTNMITNQAGTVDTTWGRIVLTTSADNTHVPVIYLASPVTGTDATEPYVGFLIGSGACDNGTPPCTSSLLDPTAPLGFLETGASANLTTASAASDYFIGAENPGDVAEGSEAGVVGTVTSGAITGTSYTSGSSGLQDNPIGGILTIDNADPNGTTFTFPGLGNIGAGSFGVSNGKRFIFFTTGSPYGSDGVNGAVIMVADQRQ